MNRSAKIQRAKVLRDRGYTYKQIGERLGVSMATAYRWLNPGYAERKYAMRRIPSGGYILPGNSGRTIWLIQKYTEGPSSGIMEWPRDKEVWGLWKWLGRFDAEQGALDPFDLDDLSQWDFFEGPHLTRAESIRRALELEGQSNV